MSESNTNKEWFEKHREMKKERFKDAQFDPSDWGSYQRKIYNIKAQQTAEPVTVQTATGPQEADVGDWIIKGPRNDFWVVKQEDFDEKYEPSENARGNIRYELNIMEVPDIPGEYEIWDLQSEQKVGRIVWRARWRMYIFRPSSQTIWNNRLLEELQTFMKNATFNRRQEKKTTPQTVLEEKYRRAKEKAGKKEPVLFEYEDNYLNET